MKPHSSVTMLCSKKRWKVENMEDNSSFPHPVLTLSHLACNIKCNFSILVFMFPLIWWTTVLSVRFYRKPALVQGFTCSILHFQMMSKKLTTSSKIWCPPHLRWRFSAILNFYVIFVYLFFQAWCNSLASVRDSRFAQLHFNIKGSTVGVLNYNQGSYWLFCLQGYRFCSFVGRKCTMKTTIMPD